MKGTLTRAVVTRKALNDPERGATYVHLLSGDYILVPKSHISELKENLEQLELQQGYLVERRPSKADPLDTRASQAIPDLTYVTVHMTVTPLTGGPKEGAAEKLEATAVTGWRRSRSG